MTQMERSEGDPLSMDVSAMSFEDADGKSMRFQVDSKGVQETPPVAGTATRGADDDMRVELTKPAPKAIDFGHDVLFPTQHIERLIEAAKNGGGAIQARVYDGSDTGAKIYATMAVVGKEASKPSDDARGCGGIERGPALAGRRLLLRRILQGFLARVHSVLRSLRERRVRQPEARLWSLRVARPPSEVGNPADVGLREIARCPLMQSLVSRRLARALGKRGRFRAAVSTVMAGLIPAIHAVMLQKRVRVYTPIVAII